MLRYGLVSGTEHRKVLIRLCHLRYECFQSFSTHHHQTKMLLFFMLSIVTANVQETIYKSFTNTQVACNAMNLGKSYKVVAWPKSWIVSFEFMCDKKRGVWHQMYCGDTSHPTVNEERTIGFCNNENGNSSNEDETEKSDDSC